jgi:predicted glycogen debranching enzyme
MLPVWTYALGVALLEKRIWMTHGANTTYVRYRLIRGGQPLAVEITPLVTYRDFHALRSGQGWQPQVIADASGLTIQASDEAVPLRLMAEGGTFTPGGTWWWNFLRREETARRLDDREDLYAPGSFLLPIQPGGSVTLVATTEGIPDLEGTRALTAVQDRQKALLRQAEVEHAHPVVQQLTLAADQFVVRRGVDDHAGKTIIAGYHWFNDWGRDTMIALPGLVLSTGRAEDAAKILRVFVKFVKDGLLPNNFSDHASAAPEYHTADASLWYVLGVRTYYEATHDARLVDDLLPVLRSIIDWYIRGTHYEISMDPADGLLRAGHPGVQLTWMDAKVGGWVVTPRIGKPVEINALWYNALRTLTGFLAARADESASRYGALADRVRASFRAKFVRADRGALADVVDGPEGDDLAIRPNQIFAVSLPFPLLEGDAAAAVVDAVGRALLTTYGLRSLSPDAASYRGEYGGDVLQRDGAYHQGTAWAWLIGPYAEAYHRVSGDPEGALRLLSPFEHHLRDGGLGTISEIFEGNAPHHPRGCIAQAWSVAEVLRVWRKLAES